jgi:predicted ATPase
MSRLKSLRVSGWKSINETDPPLAFGPINVLIGANGSGKSNLISFFKLLNELLGERLQAFVGKSGGAESLLHYGSKKTLSVIGDLELETGKNTSRYFIELTHAAVDTLIFSEETFIIAEERVEFHVPDNPSTLRHVLGSGHKESLLKLQAADAIGFGTHLPWVLERDMSRFQVFHFHDTSETAKVRQSGYVEENHHLLPDAGNLASMLYLYKTMHPDAYRRIVSTVRQLVKSFGDFALEPQRFDPKSILLNWRQFDRDYLFGPHQLSDGSLRAMAIATLFLQPESDLPDMIVLDEPELGLHPQALELLLGLIRSVSHRTQVILATQSPTLLDYFEPAEIIVADLQDGASRFRRLDEERLKDWLEDYGVGELWQKNVIGGGPLP